MKLHFEPDLDFQLQAIEAVCDLFRGDVPSPAISKALARVTTRYGAVALCDHSLSSGRR